MYPMRNLSLYCLSAAILALFAGPSNGFADSANVGTNQTSESPKAESVRGLLPDDRVIVGTVEEIKGDQIKIDTGEVQPRYLPLEMAKEKDLAPIKKGDKLVATLNQQNLVVDFHPFGEPGKHRILRGQLVAPLVVGHDQAVIRTQDGTEESLKIRPLARSRMAGLPAGPLRSSLWMKTTKSPMHFSAARRR